MRAVAGSILRRTCALTLPVGLISALADMPARMQLLQRYPSLHHEA